GRRGVLHVESKYHDIRLRIDTVYHTDGQCGVVREADDGTVCASHTRKGSHDPLPLREPCPACVPQDVALTVEHRQGHRSAVRRVAVWPPAVTGAPGHGGRGRSRGPGPPAGVPPEPSEEACLDYHYKP